MKCIFFTLLVFISFVATGLAQSTFVDGGSNYFPKLVYSGVAVAVADVDGDYRDDIVSFDKGGNLVISLFRGANTPLVLGYEAPFVIGDVWSVVVGDVTGDGRADIMTGSIFDVQLFTQGDDFTFTRQELYGIDWLPQAANLTDVDQDGDLDFYLCNDEGLSLVLQNDGLGNFEASDMIDFATVPISDNSGSYGSIWTDIDNDGDLDLYVAKCRAGATDPTDPRRINTLYVNNGDGTYSERAADFNLADGLQSWSVDSGDIDNDGDMDLFITNHDGPHKLYINEGVTFVEYPNLPQISSFAIQGVFHDIDNNGWLDIVISDGQFNSILYNHSMQFVSQSYQLSGHRAKTSVVGDFNADGFGDIWAQFPDGLLAGGTDNFQADRIWWNETNVNNYLVVSLADEINQATTGAKVSITTDSKTLTREIKIGSSYGQQSSSNLHFGLGADTEVLSMTIFWPNGEVEEIDVIDLAVNEHHIITRGGCITQVESIVQGNLALICPGGELTLTSAKDIPVSWNIDPDISVPSINISSVGSYAYQYDDQEGCRHYSDYLVVQEEAVFYEQVLTNDSLIFFCEGASLELKSLPAASYLWSTGAETQAIEVSESNSYAVTATSHCGIEYNSDTVHVNRINVEPPMLSADTVAIGQPAKILSNQTNTNWYIDAVSTDPIFVGEEYITGAISGPTTFYASVVSSDYNRSGRVGVSDLPSENKYSANFQSSGLVFTVENPIVINSVVVDTDIAGPRSIIITSLNLLDSFHVTDIDLAVGQTRIELSAELSSGRYMIATDQTENLQNFGFISPRFSRVQGDLVQYPYELGADLAITGGTNGSTRYHYFFDWDVSFDFASCESERVPVEVATFPVSTSDESAREQYFWPNPAVDQILISSTVQPFSVQIFSLNGAAVVPETAVSEDGVVDVSQLQSGLYVVEASSGAQILFREKLLILK